MIGWLTAFVDVPPERFEATLEFWTRATGATPSPSRGAHGQILTLVPPSGDSHLRMQSLGDEVQVHLDLHAYDIAETVALAGRLGAEPVVAHGDAVLRSPSGLRFRIVNHDGEHDRGPRLDDPVEHRLDVVVIDVPGPLFERECRFWSELLNQEPNPGDDEFPEFIGFALRHQGLPWNMLVQRLGTNDQRTTASAHLDVSAGPAIDSVAALVDRHLELGATIDRRFDAWTVMRDPAGLAYCITDRPPD